MAMTLKTKQLAIQALQNLRGDDYERAKLAFGGLSEDEMNAQYGSSGKTRAEILEGYAHHVAEVEAAIEEIRRA